MLAFWSFSKRQEEKGDLWGDNNHRAILHSWLTVALVVSRKRILDKNDKAEQTFKAGYEAKKNNNLQDDKKKIWNW